MIDYLELLLQEQWEEDTDTPARWPGPDEDAAAVRRAEQPPEALPAATGAEGPAGWVQTAAAGVAADGGAAAVPAVGVGAPTPERGISAGAAAAAQESGLAPGAAPEDSWVQTYRQQVQLAAANNSRRTANAAILYRQLTAGAEQAGYVRPAAGQIPLPLPVGTAGPQGLSPEGLDRVFRRDARRYDSGFTLY